MVATNRYKQLNMRKLLPALSLALGALAAGLIAAAPPALLDAAVARLRLAALVPGAAPPIGLTGRTLLAFAGGGLIVLAGLLPGIARLLFTRRRRATRLGATPPLRRADAHPDAPARRPIAARSELGEPLLADPTPGDEERALPADLDLPLADFDPDAFASAPPEARGERFETFPLPGAAEVKGQPADSIAALLERLERGAATRARGRRLDDTLGALRKLAAH
ncbi:MAG: hypothetical protein BGO24_07585 [Sphingomonas sp. 67-36]|nr:MAG: hypothetical protein BGO24_07585 [Sphingomonas sp. 67-36]